jgi:hypothetical protein
MGDLDEDGFQLLMQVALRAEHVLTEQPVIPSTGH